MKFDILTYAKKFVGFLDIAVLGGYLFIIHYVAAGLDHPLINSNIIFHSYFAGTLVFIVSLYILFKIRGFFKINIQDHFYQTTFQYLLQWACFISGIIILISIGFSLIKNWNLIQETGLFSLRAISTSLHRLVPFESRWIYLVGPLVLFTESLDVRVRYLRILNLGLWIVLLFITQMKFNFIFFAILVGVWGGKELLLKFKLRTLGLMFFAMLMSLIGLYMNMATNESSVREFMAHKEIVAIEKNDWEKTQHPELCISYKIDDSKSSQQIAPSPVNSELSLASLWQQLIYRLVGTAGHVTRAFYCLREEADWSPQFKGHQLFRFIGGYKPVYRWIMEAVNGSHGATAVTSAVANFMADSYLNAGWTALIISSILASLGWLFLFGMSKNLYFVYLRFLFIMTLATQGIITSLIIPIFGALLLLAGFLSRSIFERSTK